MPVLQTVRQSFQSRVSSLRLPNCCFWKVFLWYGGRQNLLLFLTPVGRREADSQAIRASGLNSQFKALPTVPPDACVAGNRQKAWTFFGAPRAGSEHHGKSARWLSSWLIGSRLGERFRHDHMQRPALTWCCPTTTPQHTGCCREQRGVKHTSQWF